MKNRRKMDGQIDRQMIFYVKPFQTEKKNPTKMKNKNENSQTLRFSPSYEYEKDDGQDT